MIDRDFESEFIDIVSWQLPSKSQRVKQALSDLEVIGGFEAGDPEDWSEFEEYIDFIGFVANKHLLFPDEVTEVADRISFRTRLSNSG